MTRTVVSAARDFLAAQSALTDLLGSDDVWETWIWEEKPYAIVEGSGQCAVILTLEGGSYTPIDHSQWQFPQLGVQMWADPERDATGVVVEDDTLDKLMAVYEVVDRLLHFIDGDRWWGHLWVTSSARLHEPQIEPISDGDGMRRAIVHYGLATAG